MVINIIITNYKKFSCFHLVNIKQQENKSTTNKTCTSEEKKKRKKERKIPKSKENLKNFFVTPKCE